MGCLDHRFAEASKPEVTIRLPALYGTPNLAIAFLRHRTAEPVKLAFNIQQRIQGFLEVDSEENMCSIYIN